MGRQCETAQITAGLAPSPGVTLRPRAGPGAQLLPENLRRAQGDCLPEVIDPENRSTSSLRTAFDTPTKGPEVSGGAGDWS